MLLFKLENNTVMAISMSAEMHQTAVAAGEEYLDEQDPRVAAYLAAQPSAKSQAWERIKTERDRRIQNGGYKVGTKWYHSDTFSRTQQMGLVMLGANIPANTPWKTMDGSFVVMTQTLAGQIFGTAAASDIAIFTAAETHKAAMEASADPAAYDCSGGWPAIYGA
jgi:Domain of unknown function (DUF4376)